MRIIQTVGAIGERSGGPSRTVTSLCSSIGKLGGSVHLVSGVNRSFDDKLILPDLNTVNLHLIETLLWGRIQYYPGFSTAVAKIVDELKQPAVIHDHGIWAHNNVAAWRTARSRQVPYILSPRGMLEPGALRFKAHIKKPAWLLYQRRIVASASVVVAASEKECESVKELFPQMPVAVIPNGVSLPGKSNALTLCAGRKRTVLFVSRIHPIKNLQGLLRAWKLLPPNVTNGWQLTIAGPDEGGHAQEVWELVRELGLQDAVELIGAVSEDKKAEVYQSAQIFALPSFSENFGVVVAEALAYGLPVITTTGTPWPELKHNACGWWVGPEPESLAAALAEAMSCSFEELHAMGVRSRKLVQKYDWERIAQQTIEVYLWALGQGPTPTCVYVD